MMVFGKDRPLWSQEKIDLMVKLLDEGLTARETARRMNAAGYPETTKNSVISRAREEFLVVEGKRTNLKPPYKNEFIDMMLSRRRNQCNFPLGDIGDSDFHYCEEDANFLEVYCAKHRKIAYYTLPRDKNLDPKRSDRQGRFTSV